MQESECEAYRGRDSLCIHYSRNANLAGRCIASDGGEVHGVDIASCSGIGTSKLHNMLVHFRLTRINIMYANGSTVYIYITSNSWKGLWNMYWVHAHPLLGFGLIYLSNAGLESTANGRGVKKESINSIQGSKNLWLSQSIDNTSTELLLGTVCRSKVPAWEHVDRCPAQVSVAESSTCGHQASALQANTSKQHLNTVHIVTSHCDKDWVVLPHVCPVHRQSGIIWASDATQRQSRGGNYIPYWTCL